MTRLLEHQFLSVGEYPDERRGLSWLPVMVSGSSLIMWAIWLKLPVLHFAINRRPEKQRAES